MKKFIKVFVFILLTGYQSTNAQGFKFIAMSDSRGSNMGVNDSVLSSAVQHIIENHSDAKFVVFAGDMIDGNRFKPERTKAELAHWKEIMSPIYNNPNMIEPKIFPVVGNHEIQHCDDEKNFCNAFPEVFNNCDDSKGLSYSFDFQNVHFTFINTDNWYYGNPNDTTDDRRDWHYIKHFEWMENDIKSAHEKGMKIFTFAHEMPFPTGGHLRDGLPNLGLNFNGEVDSIRQFYLSRRDRFWEILKENNVIAHICGHEHLYSRQLVEGVYQLIVGSSGAPLYRFNPLFGEETLSKGPLIQEMTYSQALPHYMVLQYHYGPGKNSQKSEDFVGYSAFNYSSIEVGEDEVHITTYGAFPAEGTNNKLGSDWKVIDEFTIKIKN